MQVVHQCDPGTRGNNAKDAEPSDKAGCFQKTRFLFVDKTIAHRDEVCDEQHSLGAQAQRHAKLLQTIEDEIQQLV